MNILFLNSIGRNKFGGGEKWMVNAAKGLAERGHHVTLASRQDSRILGYAAEKGVRTAVMEIHADLSPLKTLRIARYLKNESIDVLICNLNKDVRVAGLAARLQGKTAVLARHGMLLCSNKWKHRITLTRLADGIITNSTTIRDAYRTYGWFDPSFVTVIYNGITIPEQVVPHDFSVEFPGRTVVYSAGRLSDQKGFPHLIEAAALLKRKRNDLVFVVSGEGKLEQELKLQAARAGMKDSFLFFGFAPDIYPFLGGCDLFVLASLFEGMPNVVMEAMAMGKPVVATDVNGARELMVDGVTGLIVPPADPQAMADAIGMLADRKDLREQFGRAGHERVCSTFSMQRMLDDLEAFLQRTISARSCRR
jgi:glycosyltransferase involved in cell wall biosynthesis